MAETKPLNLRTLTYNKLLSLKSGECTTFSKVVEKLISENKQLKKDNEQLSKDLIKSIHEIEQLEKKR